MVQLVSLRIQVRHDVSQTAPPGKLRRPSLRTGPSGSSSAACVPWMPAGPPARMSRTLEDWPSTHPLLCAMGLDASLPPPAHRKVGCHKLEKPTQYRARLLAMGHPSSPFVRNEAVTDRINLTGSSSAIGALPCSSSARQSARSPARRTDAEIRQILVRQSIAGYSGSCPCPYNTDRAGRRCGRRSAYSKPGGASPLCYPGDVSDRAVETYRGRTER